MMVRIKRFNVTIQLVIVGVSMMKVSNKPVPKNVLGKENQNVKLNQVWFLMDLRMKSSTTSYIMWFNHFFYIVSNMKE